MKLSILLSKNFSSYVYLFIGFLFSIVGIELAKQEGLGLPVWFSAINYFYFFIFICIVVYLVKDFLLNIIIVQVYSLITIAIALVSYFYFWASKAFTLGGTKEIAIISLLSIFTLLALEHNYKIIKNSNTDESVKTLKYVIYDHFRRKSKNGIVKISLNDVMEYKTNLDYKWKKSKNKNTLFAKVMLVIMLPFALMGKGDAYIFGTYIAKKYHFQDYLIAFFGYLGTIAIVSSVLITLTIFLKLKSVSNK